MLRTQFPATAVLDERYVTSPPVCVDEFGRWSASATLDAELNVDPALRGWFDGQLARNADISVDGLQAEAPQQVLLRRVREEAAVICAGRDGISLADVPDLEQLDAAGVSISAANECLPTHSKLGLEGCGLESVRHALLERTGQKRTARGREDASLSAALMSRQQRARSQHDEGQTSGPAEAVLAEREPLVRVTYYHARRVGKQRELIVTGTQTLGDLRDAFTCDTERMVTQVAAQRNLGTSELPGRASAMLISGRWYTDVVGGVDVSAPLRDWLSAVDPSGTVAHYDDDVLPMHSTRIGQLTIELGAQNIFVHLGECEHVFVFTDLWANTAEDVRHRSAYPLPVFEARQKVETCFVCKQHAARHFTVGAHSYLLRLGLENPSFMCEHCYHAVHYGPDDRLLHDDFRSYEVRSVEGLDGGGEEDEETSLAAGLS
ncbi:snRNA-activating protein of 50kDa MW C terminal-domain-containing protein [Pavlovales sp. CCMP2436]|nr:snRNA-activating protein of 50kDa MW C terminal-domain-containing protein [Pavlovales sp. CCMP2436]